MDVPQYSLGFFFKRSRLHDMFTDVCLIQKNKPEWMKGRLNGVGGKLESDELPLQCMIREFEEETGVRVTNWAMVAVLNAMVPGGRKTTVFVYKGWTYDDVGIRSTTDEPVAWYNLNELWHYQTVPNLHWLIPMCLHDPDYVHHITDVKR